VGLWDKSHKTTTIGRLKLKYIGKHTLKAIIVNKKWCRFAESLTHLFNSKWILFKSGININLKNLLIHQEEVALGKGGRACSASTGQIVRSAQRNSQSALIWRTSCIHQKEVTLGKGCGSNTASTGSDREIYTQEHLNHEQITPLRLKKAREEDEPGHGGRAWCRQERDGMTASFSQLPDSLRRRPNQKLWGSWCWEDYVTRTCTTALESSRRMRSVAHFNHRRLNDNNCRQKQMVDRVTLAHLCGWIASLIRELKELKVCFLYIVIEDSREVVYAIINCILESEGYFPLQDVVYCQILLNMFRASAPRWQICCRYSSGGIISCPIPTTRETSCSSLSYRDHRIAAAIFRSPRRCHLPYSLGRPLHPCLHDVTIFVKSTSWCKRWTRLTWRC
jgi:hypothetical protein